MLKNILLFILIIGFLPLQSSGQISTGENHPELGWNVRETEHFQIVFHDGIELLAEEAAQIVETIYEPITSDLGAKPGQKNRCHSFGLR